MSMEKEIQNIKERNARVEADKAWEISKTRRLLIAIFTYIVAVIVLFSINAPNPFLNALVPTIAFLLSTLTVPTLKEWWVRNFYRKQGG